MLKTHITLGLQVDQSKRTIERHRLIAGFVAEAFVEG